MYPACRVVEILPADGVEGQAFSPHAAFWPLVDAFDEARKYPGMGVCRSGSQEDGIRVPGDSGDGAPNRLLQLLRHPPVVFLLKIANSDDSRPRTDGKLGLGGRPTYKGSRTIDA